jgi:hypothetical protein
MWILITFVYYVGVMDGRTVSVDNVQFNDEPNCVAAGKAFANMANNNTYTAKFICVKR